MEFEQSLMPYDVLQISTGTLLPTHKLSAVESVTDFSSTKTSSKE